jgi:hypothetical protein
MTMYLLTIALVIVAALLVINLALVLGVIKRLREHSELISQALRPPATRPVIIRSPGERIDGFVATTTEGQKVTNESLGKGAVVAFFSAHCPACEIRLPEFVQHARDVPGGRAQILTVVVGQPEDVANMVKALAPIAKVVVESEDGPLSAAFGVRGFPAICRLGEGGEIAASGYELFASKVLKAAA